MSRGFQKVFFNFILDYIEDIISQTFSLVNFSDHIGQNWLRLHLFPTEFFLIKTHLNVMDIHNKAYKFRKSVIEAFRSVVCLFVLHLKLFHKHSKQSAGHLIVLCVRVWYFTCSWKCINWSISSRNIKYIPEYRPIQRVPSASSGITHLNLTRSTWDAVKLANYARHVYQKSKRKTF